MRNREAWLQNAIKELDKKFFADKGYELPENMGISCGFPRGSSRAIGQCFDPKMAADDTTHMFICPNQADPIQVLGIVLHEMIHASVGIEVGHKGIFRKLAKEFGLAGKMTATFVEESSELWHELCVIRDRLGEYPHAAMRKPSKGLAPRKYVKFYSLTCEEYIVTTSVKIYAEHGAPKDPWGEDMVEKE